MSRKTIGIDDALHDYLLTVSLRESDIMRRLREATAALPEANMQLAPEQAQLLGFLVELTGARRCLEIGTFTGYSTLSVAASLPSDGTVVACDVSEPWTQIARGYWREAGVLEKIDLRLASAADTLRALISSGETGTFDFALIDADKENYRLYYEGCLELLRNGGLVAIDNVLWHRRVIDQSVSDSETTAIREFNIALQADNRVSLSLIPIGDGMTLARKRPT
jgi:predicted O-methyltransferase YrrM